MPMESTAIEDDVCGWCFGPPQEGMAQCDGCKKWFHFECVSLTAATVTEEWQCTKCIKGSHEKPTDELTPGEITREIDSLRRQLEEQRIERTREREQLEASLSRVSAAQREQRNPTYASRVMATGTTPCHSRYETRSNDHELSRSQLAARNVVSGKLPTFSGNPDEWCSFKSRFDTSTRMCGFTDDENVMRLQECLTGRALRAVQCRLHQPQNLPDVMGTLEKLFGRPEVLINSILQQIRDAPLPKMERLQTIIDYGVAVEELCATVRNSGLQEQLVNAALLQELVDRLPPNLRLDWGLHRRLMRSTVSLESFGSWMNSITDAAILVTPPAQDVAKRAEVRRVYSHHETPEKDALPCCLVCAKKDCRAGAECRQFLSATVEERWNCLRRWRLCRTCLWNHNGRCHITQPCGESGCTAYHHKLLHNYVRPNRQPTRPAASLSHAMAEGKTLLKYIPITVHGAGKSINTYALLDDGSAVTLMDHDLLEELGLEGYENPICLGWTGDQTREEPSSRTVALKISPLEDNEKTYLMRKVHTVAELALPQQTLAVRELMAAYEYLNAADVRSYNRVMPRILIGIDNYHLLTPLKTIEGLPGQPVAAKTRLGWIICGTHGKPTTSHPHSVYTCTCAEVDHRLDEALRKYFLTEHLSYDSPKTILTKRDKRALVALESVTRFTDDRYETGLLWKSDNVSLPDNRKMAMKRLECLERRMKREMDLADAINGKLSEHLAKGYVRRLSAEELTVHHPRKWYLPIFPVLNPNKPGKVRLVWDAAAMHRGTSLNANLMSGPDLLTPLPAVLHKFREYKFAITADIREMYHQVRIIEKDTHSQRFLWRWGNTDNKPEEFVMNRMTFGATCSPSSALYVKNLNADRFAAEYPCAVQCIKEQHYVDDMLASTEQEEDALKLAQDVQFIHGEGGFELHNWFSNSALVNTQFNSDVSLLKEMNFDTGASTEKILGMWWNWRTDTFQFRVTPKRDRELLEGQQTPTKRQVLRILMSIYDPLGLVAGYLWFLKVILQDVWRAGVGWDEPITADLDHRWREWLAGLRVIENVSIPRCYRLHVNIDGLDTQLHVFVDAGKDGYAAVAYLRFENDGIFEVCLIGGKAKVAPLQYISVPRMELQAAVIGARLAANIQQTHTLPIRKCVLWTDSRDVMCWLNSDHRKYSIFVAHRVAEIQEKSNVNDWRWIPTQQNVADECTKWGNLRRHLKNTRWFDGPEFLVRPATEWPRTQPVPLETEEEARKHIGIHHIAPAPQIMFERFETWRTLTRAMGYVWRFINNSREANHEQRKTGLIHQDELPMAEHMILREVQRQTYPEEHHILQQSLSTNGTTRLPRTSKLYKRSPYLDEDGLIRVKGRIDACEVATPDMKRPIILPKTGIVTDLIVQDYHRRFRHANTETVMNELRARFEIPGLRRACKRAKNNCYFCRIRDAKPSPPTMSELPPARLAAFTRPFSYTGIDYFGPIVVSIGRRRTEKRWGVLFTCLTVRAIHIEVAYSLSTDACILAIRNFIVRRGTPIEMFSDQGTNFVGANRELREAAKMVDMERLIDELNIPNMKWTFNPPSAPHFGGAWERMVQMVKRTLAGMPFHHLPTDPILRGMLVEAEGIINTRPLTHVPVDRQDDAPLTPNHFLLGSSAGAKPLLPFDDTAKALRNNWKATQQYADVLWKRWVKGYLPTLTRRTKWFEPTEPVKVGDRVLIVDENLPRNCWPRGTVEGVTASRDGVVRRAVVRTTKGTTLERPVVKLAKLMIERKDSATETTHGGECQ